MGVMEASLEAVYDFVKQYGGLMEAAFDIFGFGNWVGQGGFH